MHILTLYCVGGEATHIHACCQTHLSFAQFVNNLNYVSKPICTLSTALNLSLSMDVTAHRLVWVSSAVTAGVTFTLHTALTLESMEHFQLPWQIYAGHGSN